jgi:hypothetical protein
MCDVKVSLTFTLLSLALLWNIFRLCRKNYKRCIFIWWVESDFKAPNLPLSLRLKVSGCHYNSIYNNTWTKQIKQLSNQRQARSNYSDFLKRHLHLRNRLLDQGYKKIRLIRSLKKFIFRYQDLVEIYSVSAYLYTFSLYENPSFIIFSAETEYISTRSWYRNINFLRDRIRRIFL